MPDVIDCPHLLENQFAERLSNHILPMNSTIQYLNSSKKLVEEVADWLTSRAAKDKSGADSLAHVCVVVPTAQSGRNLRLTLAKRFPNGIIPPMVVQPMRLARGAESGLSVASKVQTGAAFLKFMEKCVGGGPAAKWPHLFLVDSLTDHEALLSFLDQLEDLWRLLGAGGFLMHDVQANKAAAAILKDALGDEAVRWSELADFESAFFGFLHELGLRHEAELLHDAKSIPPDLPAEIDEVVLPALADPVPLLVDILSNQRVARKITVLLHADEPDKAKFDDWGRPRVECWTGQKHPVLSLGDDDIICASTDGKLAVKIADDFPGADDDKALPSLGLCDETLFNELSAAFMNKGYELHNPEKFRLSASSLGRIAGRLLTLYAGGASYPWDDFVALLRENDILRHVIPIVKAKCEEGKTDCNCVVAKEWGGKKLVPSKYSVLEGLDIYRNAFFPSVLPAECHVDLSRVEVSDRLRAAEFLCAAQALRELVDNARKGTSNAADFLREAFRAIYDERKVGSGTTDCEFAAAIGALREVLAQFDDASHAGLGLADSAATALLRKCLADATYSLEPDSPDALMTEGWLELAWSLNDKVALAGFNEGAVPDSVSGHVFLPDALRAALGLPSNDQRLARDTFLLKSILGARVKGDVRAYFARTNDAGDIHRPSRLLFLVDDDHIPARAKALFGGLPPDKPRAPRKVVPGWRPSLPREIKVPHAGEADSPEGRLSASAIDKWLSCPLAYLLEYGLDMRRVEEKRELGADDFGKMVHKVLEEYAKEQLARSADKLPQLSDRKEIHDTIRRIFSGIRAGYGRAPSLKISLQLDAVQARLDNFAAVQATWAAQGWRIEEMPEFDFVVRPFKDEGDADVQIKGFIDRIDYKEGVGYRLIDYKTWDDTEKARGHVISSGKAEADFAEKFKTKLPAFNLPSDFKTDGTLKKNAFLRRFLSVQLPLYGHCLEKVDPKFAGKIADYCYLVLGKNFEKTGVFGSKFEEVPDKSEIKSEDRKKFGIGSVHLADTTINEKALETARVAIRAIRSNLFWPPGPGKALSYDLKDIFLNSPEGDLKDSDWLAEQKRRLDAFTGKGK